MDAAPQLPPTGLSDVGKGVALAVSSSLFIGASFIVKKKGLRLAGATGLRAGAGGYSYLREPLWWAGMITMVVGEAANFAAYAFAPAIVVTPLGALSIIVSAVLAHVLLGERLPLLGWLGCALCCVGSVPLVLHAPPEAPVHSVRALWALAAAPFFVWYALTVVTAVGFLVVRFEPRHGAASPLAALAVCSLVGSLSVLSLKALGTALRLTLGGANQLADPATWVLAGVVAACVVTQMAYLNKALDTFPTAVVTPLYYVLFTSATLAASAVLFQDWRRVTAVAAATQASGFLTILAGVALLHYRTRDGDRDGTAEPRGGAASPAQHTRPSGTGMGMGIALSGAMPRVGSAEADVEAASRGRNL